MYLPITNISSPYKSLPFSKRSIELKSYGLDQILMSKEYFWAIVLRNAKVMASGCTLFQATFLYHSRPRESTAFGSPFGKKAMNKPPGLSLEAAVCQRILGSYRCSITWELKKQSTGDCKSTKSFTTVKPNFEEANLARGSLISYENLL